MKVGSLVECIRDIEGLVMINGQYKKAVDPVFKGNIYTVSGMMKSYHGKPVLSLQECIQFTHPVLKTECGYPIESFREIQPPMDVTALIEECKTETV